MADHKVFCVKLKKELPGLDEPPFDTELGKKVYENVSRDAWHSWMEFCKMLLNEYRLNPARKEDQEVIVSRWNSIFLAKVRLYPLSTSRLRKSKQHIYNIRSAAQSLWISERCSECR